MSTVDMYAQAAPYFISGMLLCARYKKELDSFLQRLYTSFQYLTSPRFYVFFDNYSMPFPAHSLNLERTLAAEPTLIYNADTSVFFPYAPTSSFAEILANYKSTTLPILSLEIVDASGTSVRDLTGFVETARYIRIPNMVAPTICDIIGAWSTVNAIPIDRDRFSVRYITMEGDEVTVPLIDTSALDAMPNPTNCTRLDETANSDDGTD